jgi:hypothetical protein
VDGAIEYLIRYEDPKIAQDSWVKATDLMCTQKIMDHYEGRVPADIERRLPPSGTPSIPLLPPDPDRDLVILGMEKADEGQLFVRFQLGDDPETFVLPQEQMAKLDKTQFVKFLESYVGKQPQS